MKRPVFLIQIDNPENKRIPSGTMSAISDKIRDFYKEATGEDSYVIVTTWKFEPVPGSSAKELMKTMALYTKIEQLKSQVDAEIPSLREMVLSLQQEVNQLKANGNNIKN